MANEPYNLLARYKMIEEALTDRRLSRGDCVVLSVILAHLDRDGEAYPGLKRICTRAGISRSTAIRAIQNLEFCQYFTTDRTMGRSNYYRIIPREQDEELIY